MNQQELSQTLSSLSRRRAEIFTSANLENSAALVECSSLADNDSGGSDRGNQIQNQDMALSLTGAQTIKLAKIDAALERIRKGTYGVCEVCGLPLDALRLSTVPEATTCIECDSHVGSSMEQVQ